MAEKSGGKYWILLRLVRQSFCSAIIFCSGARAPGFPAYALASMFIRRVFTRNNTTGESYFTHRLVRTERVANKVRQVTLLNLGRHFAVAQEDWPSLCPRIEEILTGQAGLLPLKPTLEELAQRYAAQLLLRQGGRGAR